MGEEKIIELITNFLEQIYQNFSTNIISKQKKNFYIDFPKIIEYDYELAEFILDQPETAIRQFNRIIIDQITITDPDFKFKKEFSVRFKKLPSSTQVELKNLRAEDMESPKFISVEGVVKLKSALIKLITYLKFECPSCGNIIKVEQDISETFKEPKNCGCGRKGAFPRIGDDMVDFYYVDLEEPLDIISDSNKPTHVRGWFRNGLADNKIYRTILPGSKIKLNGFFTKRQKRNSKGQLIAMMDVFFEVSSVEFLQETFEDLICSVEEINKFHEIANKPDWLDYLRKNIFAEIKGQNEECKSIILQMVGGVKVKKKEGLDIKGGLNILLLGDPGSAKSSLLKITHKFAPKAKYIAGSAVSGAGLIGTVVKNEFGSGWDLQAGAFTLANQGMLMIDEMDKISHENKQAMHEPLSEECYHPDTLIVFSDGSQKKIGSFVNDVLKSEGVDFDSLTSNDKFKIDFSKKIPSFSFSQKQIINTDTNYLYSVRSTSELVKIGFSNGFSMKVTPTHPVYYYGDNGEVQVINADKVVPGLKVPFTNKIDFERCEDYSLKNVAEIFDSFEGDVSGIKNYPLFFDESLAELLGAFCNKGHIGDGYLSLILRNKSLLKKIRWTINKNFGVDPSIINMCDEKNQKYLLVVNDEFFVHWFKKNFGCLLSEDPCLPSCVLADKDLNRFFLGGFINNQKDFMNVTHRSKELLERIQLAFLAFGITSNVKKNDDKVNYDLNLIRSEEQEVKIMSVELIKSNTDWVYDVNIPMTHNFIGINGLLLHNTISFSKAGVDQVLPAEVAVLAAANPKHGSFSTYDDIYSQADITSTLFNRFDLVHIFKEVGDDEEFHRMLAEKIIENANSPKPTDETNTLFFKKYIAYAKQFNPKFSPEVVKYLSESYARLKSNVYRNNASDSGKKVPITPRNIDSLRRLVQAVARSRFRDEASLEDAEIAFNLLVSCLSKLGIDPSSGNKEIFLSDAFDDKNKVITTKDVPGIIKNTIRSYWEQHKQPMPESDLLAGLKARGFAEQEIFDVINRLRRSGDVYEPMSGKLKTT